MRRLLLIALLTFSVNTAHAVSLYTSGAATSTLLLSSSDPGVVANYLFQDGSGTNLKNNYHGTGAHGDGTLQGSAAWVVGSTDSIVGRGNPRTNVVLNNTAGTYISLTAADYTGMKDITQEFIFRATSNFTDDALFSLGLLAGSRMTVDVVSNPVGYYYLDILVTDGVATTLDVRGPQDKVYLGQWSYLGVAWSSASLTVVMRSGYAPYAKTVYQNFATSATFSTGAASAGVNLAYLGQTSSAANPFGGNLAQYRVSARTLSAAEMIRNAKRTVGGGSE